MATSRRKPTGSYRDKVRALPAAETPPTEEETVDAQTPAIAPEGSGDPDLSLALPPLAMDQMARDLALENHVLLQRLQQQGALLNQKNETIARLKAERAGGCAREGCANATPAEAAGS